ncbi:hypothetical protein AHAS_Ahas15G0229400 [Arachis hypogaea]
MALQLETYDLSHLPIKTEARYYFTALRERCFPLLVGVMESTVNIMVYHNGEIIRNTYEGVSFACENDRTEAYKGMNNDSDEEFEATYEASDEDEDGDGRDLDAMHALEFPEYVDIGVADLVDSEFRIEWNTVLENQSLWQFGVTLSLKESITLFMNLSHRRSMQNARLLDVGAIGLSKSA